MKVMASHQILAVVSMNRDSVGGQTPIFYVSDHHELEKTSLYLARILMAAIHDLDNGTYILVKH